MSNEGDEGFQLTAWSDVMVDLPGPTRWKLQFVLSLTFPGYDEDTFEPHAPWEDGRVFSMELQATNSPGEIDFEEYEPYDDEASQRVITDLQRSIAGLAWR